MALPAQVVVTFCALRISPGSQGFAPGATAVSTFDAPIVCGSGSGAWKVAIDAGRRRLHFNYKSVTAPSRALDTSFAYLASTPLV
jgi:hypothetical protein